MSNLHISISAEPVFHIGSLPITNSILTTWLVTAFFIYIIFVASKGLKKVKPLTKPGRWQSFLEYLIESFLNLTQTTTNSFKKTRVFFPFVLTFFSFIIISNWSGLIPGVGTIGFREEEKFIPFFRAPTADLNTTIALSLFTMTFVQIMGIKYVGMGYFKKFLNLSNPIGFFVGLLEMMSEISRIISFAFRLFGNIFAGEVLLAVIAYLVPVLAPLPFIGMEIFVGFIQALVFSMLTLVFFNMASTNEHEEAH
jgi:F-type H+-transporting ATPase subunit a